MGLFLQPKSRYGPTLSNFLHNVGIYYLVDDGKFPRNWLNQKLEKGDFGMYNIYIISLLSGESHSRYIERRRKRSFGLFYMPWITCYWSREQYYIIYGFLL